MVLFKHACNHDISVHSNSCSCFSGDRLGDSYGMQRYADPTLSMQTIMICIAMYCSVMNVYFFLYFDHIHPTLTEPQLQFNLVADHIMRVRRNCPQWRNSPVIIYVERNLGHEAEHHRHALKDIPNVKFRIDAQRSRVGVLTTNETKHGMATMLNVFLREKRVHVWKNPLIVSLDPKGALASTNNFVYGYQFKGGTDTFAKDRVALSGKIGGMKDDVAIALQLGVYFTELDARNGFNLK